MILILFGLRVISGNLEVCTRALLPLKGMLLLLSSLSSIGIMISSPLRPLCRIWPPALLLLLLLFLLAMTPPPPNGLWLTADNKLLLSFFLIVLSPPTTTLPPPMKLLGVCCLYCCAALNWLWRLTLCYLEAADLRLRAEKCILWEPDCIVGTCFYDVKCNGWLNWFIVGATISC